MNTEILWYASRSTGAVAMVLLTLVLVLGILTAARAGGPVNRAAMLRIHRAVSLGALVFTAVHIATAIADGYVDLTITDIVVPFGSGFDPFWIGLGAIAVDLMIAVIVTSAVRRHLPHKLWWAVHLGAYAMWPIALLHGWGTGGGDAASVWMIATNIACIAAVLVALVFRLTRLSAKTDLPKLSARADRAPNRHLEQGVSR